LVTEEIAWLSARFRGRLGVGFGPGISSLDFEAVGVPWDDRRRRYREGLEVVVASLSGRSTGLLSEDRAIAACGQHPVPCVSTVGGPIGARRAARLGLGIVPASSASTEEVQQLINDYTSAGGSGPRMLNRRAWYGPPDPGRIAALDGQYAARSDIGSEAGHYKADFIASADPAAVAGGLAEVRVATGATALNMKFYFPGLSPQRMREQITAFGADVLPALRAQLDLEIGQGPRRGAQPGRC
jgi:alkanesulfonate monooxygenase SsuD/methylene tetrahydromethanopterin reductase-like flavin-dependent oxidoreductase (luciferase family)